MVPLTRYTADNRDASKALLISAQSERILRIEGNAHSEIHAGSDREFGFVIAGVFAIISILPLAGGGAIRFWAVAIAAAFFVTAIIRPKTLQPLNRIWFRFSLLLGAVLSPVVMGLVFFVVVTPTAIAMRLSGMDPLRLRFDKEANTYWIARSEESASNSMRYQY